MSVILARADVGSVLGAVPEHHRRQFLACAEPSRQLWVGLLDGKLVCVWGLIPPTMISSRAYLWLYTTPALEGNEFIFVRHSQRAVENMLKEYPIIRGHATKGAERAHRWLRWLGARFFEPQGDLIPFEIRKRHG